MLYRYSEVLRGLMMVADLALIAAAWMGAYALRFGAGFPAPLGVPSFRHYALALLAILPVGWVLLRRQGLYEPKRLASLLAEAGDIVKATATGVVILLAASFFVRSYSFSRGVVVIFSLAAPTLLVALRVGLRTSLRVLRKRGYNRRFVLVVGGGRLAEEVVARIHDHPHAGLHVRGVLAEGPRGRRIAGVPVIGGYADLRSAFEIGRIDQVIIALSRDEAPLLDKILGELEDSTASVKLAPDLLHILTLRSSVEELDGLPIISLRDTPLLGWASVQKRVFDLVGSALGLLLALPVLAVLAGLVALTTGRPVLYRQRRVGLDGREFDMLKLRTMRTDAEEEGAGWSRPDDPRRTRVGALLRRFSLDELPQLWNVLRGEMSLVGPRPERPVFISEFRREIPGYMLRHKVKSGMTGWAQVHGWRGDTSMRERIEHDIYYIQNWSLGLDLEILLMTLWSVLRGRNAY
ncbi:MAG TPA: undecaprenyl-phosphate glucose phosphotransferase [Alphaproteobacteria bacterium]|nr:undecaprenyl-phosphate glucose phosphotransferase [Alphaproteobacteria bacterium]